MLLHNTLIILNILKLISSLVWFNSISKSVTEGVAMELLCTFLVYEYKGAVTTLTEILPNDLRLKGFLKDISDFYMRERLCVLYCGQAILSGAVKYSHPFSVNSKSCLCTILLLSFLFLKLSLH